MSNEHEAESVSDEQALATELAEIEEKIKEADTLGKQSELFEDVTRLYHVGRIYPGESILDAAFAHYRTTGFPYRNLAVHLGMQELNELASITDESALQFTRLGYHVADTYHPHRYLGQIKGKKTPMEAYLDDRRLRLALAMELDEGGKISAGYPNMLNMVRGTQACSNFRPGYALYIYRKFAGKKDPVILDTSTGYGGRLTGFLCLKEGRYFGIDPSTKTHMGNLRLAMDYDAAERVTLINLPAEDVCTSDYGLDGACDLAFTSPPYFSKEHYCEEPTQSWKRYATPEKWRDGFLRGMLRVQFDALKPGAINVVNIEDVNIDGKRIPLVEMTKSCAAEQGFVLEDTMQFGLVQKRFGANQSQEKAVETVLVWRKP